VTTPATTQPDLTELARVLSHYDTGVVKRIEPIRRGVGNSVKWAIACEKGPLLLKRRPVGVDEPLLALIQLVQMEASRAGFPVPEAVPVGNGGAALLKLDGRLYEMNRFVASTGFDQSPAACRAAGSVLGRLHGVMAKMVMPPVSGPVGGAGAARGYHRLLRVQTDLVSAGDRLRGDARKITRHLGEMYTLAGERASAAGAERWPPQLIHGDWHPGNLLFEGGKVVGLIDFDSVRPSPRAMDVAYGALQFSLVRGEGPAPGWPAHADRARMGEFLKGYDSDAPALLTREEGSALAWLMIEALIAEAAGPLAAAGEFGGIDGLSMLRMIESKSAWLRDHQAEVAGMVG
jgi:homoserine kinase type II